jgi:hypothetical protein
MNLVYLAKRVSKFAPEKFYEIDSRSFGDCTIKNFKAVIVAAS